MFLLLPIEHAVCHLGASRAKQDIFVITIACNEIHLLLPSSSGGLSGGRTKSANGVSKEWSLRDYVFSLYSKALALRVLC